MKIEVNKHQITFIPTTQHDAYRLGILQTRYQCTVSFTPTGGQSVEVAALNIAQETLMQALCFPDKTIGI